MGVALLLCALVAVVFSAPQAFPRNVEIFGIYTDFGPGLQRTIVRSGRVNLTSGAVIRQQTLFVYEGSSGTFDGISAYAQDSQIIRYANDFADSYVFSVSTKAPFAIGAPIFLEDNGVESIVYDWKNKRTLISDYVKQTNSYRLVIYPDNMMESTTVIALPVPAGLAAFDGEKQLYLNLLPVSANTSVLYTTNTTTGFSNSSSISVQCGNLEKMWVFANHPDFDSRLWAVNSRIVNNQIFYNLVNINTSSGACQTVSIAASGIVTAWSFDERSGVLFYHDAANSGNYIRTTDVRNGFSSQLTLQTQNPFSDMAVRFIF